MKIMNLFLALAIFGSAASADVFFEDQKDVFKCPVSRSSNWIFTWGSDELEPRAAIYEVDMFSGARKEAFGFKDDAYFGKTTDNRYVYFAQGDSSVSILFTPQYKSDKYTAKIQFSGKAVPFEGTVSLEECTKLAD